MNELEPTILKLDGAKVWYLNGKLHREDGPAVECDDGDKMWYQNGKFHRIYGPAVEYVNGNKAWYLNGELHRIDGPSVFHLSEEFGNLVDWYLNSSRISVELINIIL